MCGVWMQYIAWNFESQCVELCIRNFSFTNGKKLEVLIHIICNHKTEEEKTSQTSVFQSDQRTCLCLYLIAFRFGNIDWRKSTYDHMSQNSKRHRAAHVTWNKSNRQGAFDKKHKSTKRAGMTKLWYVL